MSYKFVNLQDAVYWVKERQSIADKRATGQSPPWTKDPILQQYRFCNVRREDDRVTKWIFDHWLLLHKDKLDVWFAMAVARLVNWPPTLSNLGYPIPWKPEKFESVLDWIKSSGAKVFTSAYMIHADAVDGRSKAAYLAERVLTPMWKDRRKVPTTSLRDLHAWLLHFRDMGSFMAGQIVADCKWADHWRNVPDWVDFAVPGPGSQRGLNRMLGVDPKTPWMEVSWQLFFKSFRAQLLKQLPPQFKDLEAHNVQNVLCEVDKYLRVKNGEGRPKQNFVPNLKGE